MPSELPGVVPRALMGEGVVATGLCPFVIEPPPPSHQQPPDPQEIRSLTVALAERPGVVESIDSGQTAWDQILALPFTS